MRLVPGDGVNTRERCMETSFPKGKADKKKKKTPRRKTRHSCVVHENIVYIWRFKSRHEMRETPNMTGFPCPWANRSARVTLEANLSFLHGTKALRAYLYSHASFVYLNCSVSILSDPFSRLQVALFESHPFYFPVTMYLAIKAFSF